MSFEITCIRSFVKIICKIVSGRDPPKTYRESAKITDAAPLLSPGFTSDVSSTWKASREDDENC